MEFLHLLTVGENFFMWASAVPLPFQAGSLLFEVHSSQHRSFNFEINSQREAFYYSKKSIFMCLIQPTTLQNVHFATRAGPKGHRPGCWTLSVSPVKWDFCICWWFKRIFLCEHRRLPCHFEWCACHARSRSVETNMFVETKFDVCLLKLTGLGKCTCPYLQLSVWHVSLLNSYYLGLRAGLLWSVWIGASSAFLCSSPPSRSCVGWRLIFVIQTRVLQNMCPQCSNV